MKGAEIGVQLGNNSDGLDKELEKEGVIESVPGRGFYVCEQKNDLLREKQMMNLENRMSELLADCENALMTFKDIIDMVRVLGEK